jgi:hypothetical protein
MEERGFLPSDPLYLLVVKARDAMQHPRWNCIIFPAMGYVVRNQMSREHNISS